MVQRDCADVDARDFGTVIDGSNAPAISIPGLAPPRQRQVRMERPFFDRDADRLQPRRRPREGFVTPRARQPDGRGRSLDRLPSVVDDEKGDPQVTGRVIGRAGNERNGLARRVPETVERRRLRATPGAKC